MTRIDIHMTIVTPVTLVVNAYKILSTVGRKPFEIERCMNEWMGETERKNKQQQQQQQNENDDHNRQRYYIRLLWSFFGVGVVVSFVKTRPRQPKR
ncbi:hypothetical protein DERF_010569 [Dermatophagoides farinae]|uniref:Transmembrane protein n=1 Tax=Dermatophagoides farinae TaxID=6954 RepID=A0A922KY88_DERFA|nr:hypothetical protein DERF_010569 [Dermatophagoides farinae]